MLLDEKEPGLSGHGALAEASTTHLSRDQRGDRTSYRQGGSADDGGKAQSDDDRLGQLLLSRRRQQSLQCGRCTCPPEAASVVMRQTPGAATGLQTFSGSLSALGVRFGAVTTPYREPFVGERVSLFREPDAGNLLVRFDEREQETGSSQTGLRGRGRKLGHTPTGRLSSLRLFSTLLPITLKMPLCGSKREIACSRQLT